MTNPKTLGQMTPTERDAAIRDATDAFQDELTRTAPAIGMAMETKEHRVITCACGWWGHANRWSDLDHKARGGEVTPLPAPPEPPKRSRRELHIAIYGNRHRCAKCTPEADAPAEPAVVPADVEYVPNARGYVPGDRCGYRLAPNNCQGRLTLDHVLSGMLWCSTCDHVHDFAEPVPATPDATVHLRIFHNVAQDGAGRPLGMLDGYTTGHPATLVAELDLHDMTDNRLLNIAYELYNVGEDPDFGCPHADAVAYRERGNRSLSIGDVVQVDTRWYACARHGWTLIDPPVIKHVEIYGTAPIIPQTTT